MVQRRPFLSLLCALVAVALLPAGASTTLEPIKRTVHITATDNKGVPITDLAAADFVVKENGKEREVVSAEPASGKLRLALAAEERLVADGQIRLGMFEFVKRMAGHADISLILIGISNRTVVDYTSDANAVLAAINNLSLNQRPDTNLADGVLEIVNQLPAAGVDRTALVVLALSGGQHGSVEPRNVLDRLGATGATMYSVTLDVGDASAGLGAMNDESAREHVLGDGPKQSGGRRIEMPVTAGTQKALMQVANELLAQYTITYVLPDGVKPHKRFNISTKRRGVTLRAPSVIPDK